MTRKQDDEWDVMDELERWEKCEPAIKQQLRAWIAENLVPVTPETKGRGVRVVVNSYGMKHAWARHFGGEYVNNGAFKGAMLEAGFEPEDRAPKNWNFPARWVRQCEGLTQRGQQCRQKSVKGRRQCLRHGSGIR